MRRYLVGIVFFCFVASTVMAQSILTALDQPTSVWSAQANQPQIDWIQVDAEAIQRLIEYVRLDTTNPPGNEIRGAEWLKKIFQAEGITF